MKDILEHKIIEDELIVSLGLLKSGFYYLYHENGTEDCLFITLQLLSGGFERLIKIILMCDNKMNKNQFLTKKELQKYSHNLKDLFDCCSKNFQINYMPAVYDFINLLSDFGIQKRYENFNKLSNEISDSYESYKTTFDTFMQIYYPIYLKDFNTIEDDLKKVNKMLIETLLELVITLLKTLQNIYPESKKFALLHKNNLQNIQILISEFDKVSPLTVFQ